MSSSTGGGGAAVAWRAPTERDETDLRAPPPAFHLSATRVMGASTTSLVPGLRSCRLPRPHLQRRRLCPQELKVVPHGLKHDEEEVRGSMEGWGAMRQGTSPAHAYHQEGQRGAYDAHNFIRRHAPRRGREDIRKQVILGAHIAPRFIDAMPLPPRKRRRSLPLLLLVEI